MDFYILRGRELVPATADEWSAWFEDERARTVAKTALGDTWGVVSTICLGANHEYRPGFPPLVFETMVFALDGAPAWLKEIDRYQMRWSTYDDAEAGHVDIVASIMMQARALQEAGG